MLPPRSMLKTRVRPGLARSRDRAIEEEDERYNPIRPSNGNMVMRGGSDLSQSSRNPRFSMAAARAGDIQTRRLTPGTGATPTMGLSQYRGGAMERYVGGAGKKKAAAGGSVAAVEDKLRSDKFLAKCYGKDIESFINDLKKIEGGDESKLDKSYSRDYDRKVYDLGEFLSRAFPKNSNNKKTPKATEKLIASINPTWELLIIGTGDYDAYGKQEDVIMGLLDGKMEGGSAVPTMGLSEFRGGANPLLDHTNVARSGAYEGQGRSRKSMPPVAMRGGKYHRDGHALSEHMLATMGAAAHKKLLGGMIQHAYGCHGGAWWDFLDPNKNGVAAAFQDFGAKAKNEFVNPESVLRGKVLPVAAKVGNVLAPVINAAGTAMGVPGVGTAISTGLNAAQGVNQEAKNIGFGRGGKKKRAPASAGDGRRKRADIVRKVMAERGVKMIEASKIVKSEGLY